jgi:hypothetical protein
MTPRYFYFGTDGTDFYCWVNQEILIYPTLNAVGGGNLQACNKFPD